MAQTVVRQKIIGNPGQRRARRKSRNPGEILGFVMSPLAGNPGRKKGGSMRKAARKNRGKARHHAKKRNPGIRGIARRTARRVARRNPGRHRHHRVHHRRRNPGMFDGGLGGALTNATFVIVGALGSKLGAQTILGSSNVGVTGYAANAATGGVMWFIAEKVLKNRAAANGIIAGTLVQIILRVINDFTPFGQYVANLGMGDYQAQSFVTPQVLTNPFNNAAISIPNGWGASPAPMAQVPAGSPAKAMTASAGMGSSNMYGRGGRNNGYGG